MCPLNTEEFLQTITEESLDERLEPCPPGDWLAIAGRPDVRDFTYKQGDREGETGYRMVIKWAIQDEEAKRQVERDHLSVTQSVLLDITEDGNGLDFGKGKNVGLGQIRGAIGQNTPGQPWSPAMIEGSTAKVNVKAGVYNNMPTAEVNGVTSI
jgi:hypothetical protein